MKGVGEAAANGVAEAVKRGGFSCIEDFVEMSGVSSAVIATMREAGAFGDMPESNQLTLFG